MRKTLRAFSGFAGLLTSLDHVSSPKYYSDNMNLTNARELVLKESFMYDAAVIIL